MLPLYVGIYILILLVVWGFFFVARHHVLKFKGFSKSLVPVTRFLYIFLILLSIIGFICVFYLPREDTVLYQNSGENLNEIYY